MLRPGGVLTMSDIPTMRMPRTPGEMLAAFTQLRVWGLGVHAAATADEIVGLALDAGFVDVRAESVGERTIGPALRFVRDRLDRGARRACPRTYELACALMLAPGRPALAPRRARLPAAARDEAGCPRRTARP